jgi:hypothetical protein
MTVNDFWSDTLMSSKAVDLEILINSNGKTIGIDFSIWLHRGCAKTTLLACCVNRQWSQALLFVFPLLQLYHSITVNEMMKVYYDSEG